MRQKEKKRGDSTLNDVEINETMHEKSHKMPCTEMKKCVDLRVVGLVVAKKIIKLVHVNVLWAPHSPIVVVKVRCHLLAL